MYTVSSLFRRFGFPTLFPHPLFLLVFAAAYQIPCSALCRVHTHWHSRRGSACTVLKSIYPDTGTDTAALVQASASAPVSVVTLAAYANQRRTRYTTTTTTLLPNRIGSSSPHDSDGARAPVNHHQKTLQHAQQTCSVFQIHVCIHYTRVRRWDAIRRDSLTLCLTPRDSPPVQARGLGDSAISLRPHPL